MLLLDANVEIIQTVTVAVTYTWLHQSTVIGRYHVYDLILSVAMSPSTQLIKIVYVWILCHIYIHRFLQSYDKAEGACVPRYHVTT